MDNNCPNMHGPGHWYNMVMEKTEQTTNGMIVRDSKGKFIKGTRPNNIIKSSDTARLMVQKRIDKFRKAAARGMTKEIMSIDSTVENVYDAWQFINARLANQIINSDIPRGDDIRILGGNIGAIQTKENNYQDNNTIDSTLANDTLLLLRDALLSVYNQDSGQDDGQDDGHIIIDV